ncbi:AMP-binding protein [Pelomonas sp. CA6]|uniref:class I adenylate-forming enzyme family protein n=1 Tax=Pelomonas sp. CA6 TaxID=2907999 RepID=UPI001F4BD049|nr:AMP-binding protein [Pelomonas sp. CA6]MCH7343926.1 AMP-binding protein [Pelomonas sp. CA6]
MDFLSVFDGNARKTPDHPCLRVQGRSISYAQLQAASYRAARVLAAQGLGPGDRLALVCFNTPGFLIALLGAWRLGAAVVPVNHKLQTPELRHQLRHSGARLCLADAALAPQLQPLAALCPMLSTEGAVAGWGDFDALCAAAPEQAPALPPVDENALAELLYTSGTTGLPKGCMLGHRQVLLAAITAALALSITRAERTLMAMPIWHSSPLNNWLLGTLYMGGTAVLLREYHPQHFLQAVQDERVTLYFGAPVSYFAPLQRVADFAAFDLSSVRAWIYGGGPIGAEQARQLMRAYRSERFFQVYGMTETGPVGTTLYPEEQIAKAGSIGRSALPGVDLRLVRDDGRDAAPDETGEIWLRAGSVMQGYLDDPEATRNAFADGGWYRSGDLARRDEDGYLFIVDRSKDMIVTGGENVYSKEVEDQLATHPQLADVAVVGRPHPEWGETVVAHVVVRPGESLSEQALKDFLAERLARYKIPREFVFADALPRTPTGKLQKFLLRRRP